jgi:hypothetical protein
MDSPSEPPGNPERACRLSVKKVGLIRKIAAYFLEKNGFLRNLIFKNFQSISQN